MAETYSWDVYSHCYCLEFQHCNNKKQYCINQVWWHGGSIVSEKNYSWYLSRNLFMRFLIALLLQQSQLKILQLILKLPVGKDFLGWPHLACTEGDAFLVASKKKLTERYWKSRYEIIIQVNDLDYNKNFNKITINMKQFQHCNPGQ